MGAFRPVDRALGAAVLVLLAVLAGLALTVPAASPGAAPTTPAGTRPPTGVVPAAATSPADLPAPLPVAPGAVGAPAPSPAPPPVTPPPASAPPASAPPAGPVTAVGDSIMLDIQPYLEADLPGVSVDGQVGRQFEAGIAVVRADRADGTLGRVLVVELGTNGTVTPADVDAMMQAAAGVARVVFVNVDVPRPWETADNAVLADAVVRYPGVAVLADWYAESSGHPEWFTPDQVHLQPLGCAALADLIAQEV